MVITTGSLSLLKIKVYHNYLGSIIISLAVRNYVLLGRLQRACKKSDTVLQTLEDHYNHKKTSLLTNKVITK